MTTFDQILAYDNRELDETQIIELFQKLVNTGLVWLLHDNYGQTATYLIELGLVREKTS